MTYCYQTNSSAHCAGQRKMTRLAPYQLKYDRDNPASVCLDLQNKIQLSLTVLARRWRTTHTVGRESSLSAQ